MSLADLKKVAKGRRIKHYYIMPRAELLHILSLPELPKNLVIEKLTIASLRAEAKAKGIRGFWSLTRGEMVHMLYPAAPTTPLPENQNGNPDQHEPPNDSRPNENGT